MGNGRAERRAGRSRCRRPHRVLTFKTLYLSDEWGCQGRGRSAAWLCCAMARTPWPAMLWARSSVACEHLLGLPGPRRLVEGRAADERDDGRRGHAAARVPRHPRRLPRRRAPRPGSAPQQRADGSWANFHERPGRPVDDDRGLRRAAPRRRRSRRRAHARRGRVRARAPAASSARACSPTSGWRCSAPGRGGSVPELPPELMLLPSWAPLSIYDFACWARQTVVAMSIVLAVRPTRCAAVRDRRAARPASRGGGRAAAPPRARALARRRPRARALRAAAAAARCARPRSRAPSAGSCAGRRPTAPGAGSSRRGSTR